MNLIISRNSVLAIIPTTLEVDEGKENEDLSKQRSVCGDRECFSRDRYISSTIGKACLLTDVDERGGLSNNQFGFRQGLSQWT
jgi:hypothetical protein